MGAESAHYASKTDIKICKASQGHLKGEVVPGVYTDCAESSKTSKVLKSLKRGNPLP